MRAVSATQVSGCVPARNCRAKNSSASLARGRCYAIAQPHHSNSSGPSEPPRNTNRPKIRALDPMTLNVHDIEATQHSSGLQCASSTPYTPAECMSLAVAKVLLLRTLHHDTLMHSVYGHTVCCCATLVILAYFFDPGGAARCWLWCAQLPRWSPTSDSCGAIDNLVCTARVCASSRKGSCNYYHLEMLHIVLISAVVKIVVAGIRCMIRCLVRR